MEITILSIGTVLVLATNKLYSLVKQGVSTCSDESKIQEFKESSKVKRYLTLAGVVSVIAGGIALVMMAPMSILMAAAPVAALAVTATTVATMTTNTLMPNPKRGPEVCTLGVGIALAVAGMVTGTWAFQALIIGGAMAVFSAGVMIYEFLFSKSDKAEVSEEQAPKAEKQAPKAEKKSAAKKPAEPEIEEAQVVPSKNDIELVDLVKSNFRGYNQEDLLNWMKANGVDLPEGSDKLPKTKLVAALREFHKSQLAEANKKGKPGKGEPATA